MMFLAYGIVIHAMPLAPMAPVAALRETGVVFAARIGSFVLGERFGRKRIAAAALVAAGIVVLVVSRLREARFACLREADPRDGVPGGASLRPALRTTSGGGRRKVG